MQEKSSRFSYRVRRAITAVKYEGGHSRFVTIPKGSVITVTRRPKKFDFVDIECKGERLAVCNRDIEERTLEL
jgi:hypothetical protein